MIDRICEVCDNEFQTKPFMVKRGHGRFCSRECHYASQRTGKKVKCGTCGKMIYRAPKLLKAAKTKNYFCNKSCQARWRNTVYIGEKHPSYKHGRASYQSVLRRVGREEICMLCKTIDKRVLVTHHIDRDRTNSDPKNLVWLCCNCHFLVHHYNVGHKEGLLKPKK